MSANKPETSIIIRAFNEERFLPSLLKAIHEQNYDAFEIIVVDSGSYDRSPNIALESGAVVVEIDSRDFTFGYSLNVGIKASRGRFVAIVSAHTEPTDNEWLGSLVEPLRNEKVAMVYGRQLGTALSKFSENLDYLRTFGCESQVLTPPGFFANNANSAVRRDLWKRHSFDETLSGLEDIEWAKYWMEKGFEVVYEPQAAIYHTHQETWPQVYRRFYREAVAAQVIGIKGVGAILPELFREGRYLAGDIIKAVRRGCLFSKAKEIALFRIHKSIGTVAGLLDGRAVMAQHERDALYFDRTCRGLIIHGPNRAFIEKIKIPEIKPSEVLIEVAYEGVCSTDLEVFSGKLGYYKTGVAHYPIIPGHEFSGWVARVGPKVENLCKGDPVVVECIQSCGVCEQCLNSNWIACKQRKEMGVIGRNGGYCEYVTAPARFVHKVPLGLDMKQAALCEPTAVVVKGLRRIEWALARSEATKPHCAVVGAGPIGHLCAQILALRGHEVTVFDRDPKRLGYFEGSAVETGEDKTELRQFDVIVEATGAPEALVDILQHSKPGSTLLLLGLPYARVEFNFETVVAYDKTIVGSVGSTGQDFEEALALLMGLDLDLFMEKVFPLEDFEAAWQAFRSRSYLKVVLEIASQAA